MKKQQSHYRKDAMMQQELALKNSAIESLTTGISIMNRQFKIQYANKSFAIMIGYANAAEIMGKFIGVLSLQKDEVKNLMGQVKKKESWTGEVWGSRKSGVPFCIHASVSLIKDYRQKQMGVIMNTIDITKIKRIEEELRDKNARLREFNEYSVNREMKMVQLKQEVNGLRKKLGEKERYAITATLRL